MVSVVNIKPAKHQHVAVVFMSHASGAVNSLFCSLLCGKTHQFSILIYTYFETGALFKTRSINLVMTHLKALIMSVDIVVFVVQINDK